jgi:hypothetical protein
MKTSGTSPQGPRYEDVSVLQGAEPAAVGWRLAALRRALWEARADFAAGLGLGAGFVAALALAVAPGRMALAGAQRSRSPFEFFVAGLCADVSFLGPACGALALLLLLGGALYLRRRGGQAVARFMLRTSVLVMAPAALLLWFSSTGAAEFRIQRGLFPTWFDFQQAFHDSGFISSSLEVLLYSRHLVPTLAAFALLGGLLAGWLLWWRKDRRAAPLPVLAGFVASVGFASVAALVPLDRHVHLFRTVADGEVVDQPISRFLRPLGVDGSNIQLGALTLIKRARVTAADVPVGAALLGLPAPPAPAAAAPSQRSAAEACRPHPLARSFPFDGPERALASGAQAPHPARAQGALDALGALSAALFAERSEPLIVWQFLLESFRADDVHALNAKAAPQISPYVDGLYQAAAQGPAAVLASTSAWQSGVRSAQGMASTICGLGMLPFHLAVGRDLGPVPARCLPDVLKDGGFEAELYYGARPSFDNADEFLRHHGFAVTGEQQMPRTLAKGLWGRTDQAVFDYALGEEVRKAGPRSRYILMVSVTNHLPYGRPRDMPQAVVDRVEQALAHTPNQARDDDRKRLVTHSYTDFALQGFMEKLEASPLASRSIVVLSGDHSTADPYVWQEDPRWDLDRQKATVPLAFVLPRALVESAGARAAQVRELARKANEELNRFPVALNDVPLLLLTLLSQSREVKGLDPAWRWHSMGGTVTSPWFGGPGGDAAMVGINSLSELYAVDGEGRRLGDIVPCAGITGPADVYNTCAPLLPVRSLLTSFLVSRPDACLAPGAFRLRP